MLFVFFGGDFSPRATAFISSRAQKCVVPNFEMLLV